MRSVLSCWVSKSGPWGGEGKGAKLTLLVLTEELIYIWNNKISKCLIKSVSVSLSAVSRLISYLANQQTWQLSLSHNTESAQAEKILNHCNIFCHEYFMRIIVVVYFTELHWKGLYFNVCEKNIENKLGLGWATAGKKSWTVFQNLLDKMQNRLA